MSESGCICVNKTDIGCPVHGAEDPSAIDTMKSHAGWLRGWAKYYGPGSGAAGHLTPNHKTLTDAAAEIDRLKHDLAKALSNHAADVAEMERLRARAETLRAALTRTKNGLGGLRRYMEDLEASPAHVTIEGIYMDIDEVLAETEPKP